MKPFQATQQLRRAPCGTAGDTFVRSVKTGHKPGWLAIGGSAEVDMTGRHRIGITGLCLHKHHLELPSSIRRYLSARG